MPDKFKDTINLPVAIPAWGLICALIIGAVSVGSTITKLNTLLDNDTKREALVRVIQDRQINVMAIQGVHVNDIKDLKERVSDLERKEWKR